MAGKAGIGLLLLFLFSSIGLSQATAPPGQHDIRGSLLFSSAKPPDERIQVHLEKNMQRLQSVFMDSIGHFEFRAVAPGDYFVVVRTPDYEEVNQSVTVFSMQRATTVTVQMNELFRVTRTRAPGFEGDDPDVIDVRMIAKKYPKKAVQAYEKALEESRKGASEQAVTLLEETVRLAPDFYHAQNNLGVNLSKLHKYEAAAVAYRHAIELNPKAQQPLLNLGILYIAEADARKKDDPETFGKLLDQAMDCLDAAIKIKPRSAMAHYYLGTALYKSDFFIEAETALKKAQEMDPAMGNVRLMLANVYMKLRRWNDVVKQIDAFLLENPKAEERQSMQELRTKIAKGAEPKPE